MTGGQMAPTTLPGQVTQTTPYGRDVNTAGYPVRVCEMLSTLDGVCYAERVAVDSVPHINATKAAIKKAFQNQIDKKASQLLRLFPTVLQTGAFLPPSQCSGCVIICSRIIRLEYIKIRTKGETNNG